VVDNLDAWCNSLEDEKMDDYLSDCHYILMLYWQPLRIIWPSYWLGFIGLDILPTVFLR
jgi:hypothetical protein